MGKSSLDRLLELSNEMSDDELDQVINVARYLKLQLLGITQPKLLSASAKEWLEIRKKNPTSTLYENQTNA